MTKDEEDDLADLLVIIEGIESMDRLQSELEAALADPQVMARFRQRAEEIEASFPRCANWPGCYQRVSFEGDKECLSCQSRMRPEDWDVVVF
jgi:hypothetical protein